MSASDNTKDSTIEITPNVQKNALIVGVNNSRVSSYLADLKYAEEDAYQVSQTLRQPACKFESISVLLGDRASTKNVRSAVIELAKKRADLDFLLFYFIGHAQPMKTKEGHRDIYFVTNDFSEDEVKEDPNAHLSMSWLRKRLYQPDGPGRVLIILDCCYAGNMIEANPDPYQVDIHLNLRKLIEECFDGPNITQEHSRLRVVLTATGYNTSAQERVMTGSILAVLQGKIDKAVDHKGYVNIHSLYSYLQDQMPQEQLPNLSGDFPRTCILAYHPHFSEHLREEARKVEENQLKDEVSKLTDKVSEVSRIITAPDFFEKRAETNHEPHFQPFDHLVCQGASLVDLDFTKVNEFFKRTLVQRQRDFRRGIPDPDQLMSFGFLQESTPTYGCLLCFAQHPQRWLSGTLTRCTYWRGTHRHDGWLDDQEFRGNLLEQLELSLGFLRKCLRLNRVIDQDGRTEQYEIPFVALEEAIANALVHREYTNRTDFVQIEVFDDRIEIRSPGAPPPPMTLELMGIENKCHPRNPQIARVFYLYGHVEKVGSGILRMQHSMQRASLSLPKFELSEAKTFTVILYRPTQPLEDVVRLREMGTSIKLTDRLTVSFEQIAPPQDQWWTGNARTGIRVPLGLTDAAQVRYMELGIGTSQHVLLGGKTGSGKSNLIHVLITNLALMYSPSEIEVYLLDFKSVEFILYAHYGLPHARVVGIGSEREFGLSVLEELDAKLKHRANLFRKAQVSDIVQYPNNQPLHLPRIILIIDEFQELFAYDDELGQKTSMLLDKLVRQGRAFGLHVILTSQALTGSLLPPAIVAQMGVRIALPSGEVESRLILSEDNLAARLLSYPGEAIYNADNGLSQGNSHFYSAFLSEEKHEAYLNDIQRLTLESSQHDQYEPRQLIVFDGEAMADVKSNYIFSSVLKSPSWPVLQGGARAWLGEPVAIKDPISVQFSLQAGSNLLLVGQQEEIALGMLFTSLFSLAAQYAPEKVHFYLIDLSLAGSPYAEVLKQVGDLLPHDVKIGNRSGLHSIIAEIGEEVKDRIENEWSQKPIIYLFICGLQRARDLHSSEDFNSVTYEHEESASLDTAKRFFTIVHDGPEFGVHTLAWCDTMRNLSRTLTHLKLGEFKMRVALQMSADDSMSFLDSSAASKLSPFRALLFMEDHGYIEKFRPYNLPSADWLQDVASQIRQKAKE